MATHKLKCNAKNIDCSNSSNSKWKKLPAAKSIYQNISEVLFPNKICHSNFSQLPLFRMFLLYLMHEPDYEKSLLNLCFFYYKICVHEVCLVVVMRFDVAKVKFQKNTKDTKWVKCSSFINFASSGGWWNQTFLVVLWEWTHIHISSILQIDQTYWLYPIEYKYSFVFKFCMKIELMKWIEMKVLFWFSLQIFVL
jgi:hypothetical protein